MRLSGDVKVLGLGRLLLYIHSSTGVFHRSIDSKVNSIKGVAFYSFFSRMVPKSISFLTYKGRLIVEVSKLLHGMQAPINTKTD